MEEHQVCHACSMVSMDLHIPMKTTAISLAIHFNLHYFLTLISVSLPAVAAPAAAAAGGQVNIFTRHCPRECAREVSQSWLNRLEVVSICLMCQDLEPVVARSGVYE